MNVIEAQDRLAMQAATTRALFALRNTNDPMRGRLMDRGALPAWRFADRTLEIDFAPEGGKIDLNFASPELLKALFRAIASSPDRAEEWLDSILQMRANRGSIRSVSEIVDACEFLGSEGYQLRDATTVWTRSKTVDPRWIDQRVASMLTTDGDESLRRSLSDALLSSNKFVADRFVNVSPPVSRLTVSRPERHGRSYRRSTILIWVDQEGFRQIADEELPAPMDSSRC